MISTRKFTERSRCHTLLPRWLTIYRANAQSSESSVVLAQARSPSRALPPPTSTQTMRYTCPIYTVVGRRSRRAWHFVVFSFTILDSLNKCRRWPLFCLSVLSCWGRKLLLFITSRLPLYAVNTDQHFCHEGGFCVVVCHDSLLLYSMIFTYLLCSLLLVEEEEE